MSVSSFISIFHSDTSLKIHEDVVKKTVEMFKEIYPDKVNIAEHFRRSLMNNKFFTFINHDYEMIEDESFIVLEFAKMLAYNYNGWALVVFSTEYEMLGRYLISVDYGIVELVDDNKFKKFMEYIATRADYLRAQRRLNELKSEIEGVFDIEDN